MCVLGAGEGGVCGCVCGGGGCVCVCLLRGLKKKDPLVQTSDIILHSYLEIYAQLVPQDQLKGSTMELCYLFNKSFQFHPRNFVLRTIFMF